MKNRIVIVDDDLNVLNEMAEVAQEAECKVLPVHFDQAMTIGEAVQDIRRFYPQIVFINERLPGKLTGGRLAKELGFSNRRFVGTSASYIQPYCARMFERKYHIKENSAKAQFLKLCRMLP